MGRWLEWLWLGERTRHHELDPIDEASIETLVATVLADVERSRQLDLARTLEARTGGNALFLRELLTALARRHRDGLELEVEAPPHLMRVLQARLEDAGPGVSRSLQTAAILGAVALSAARRACSDEAIDAAEQDGWLIVEDGPRAMARPAHPLYAEAALAALSVAERRRLTRTVATAVLDDHGSTGSERLHATTALVDVGSPVRVADLVSAAQSAFSALDHDLAARLAIAAIADGGGFEAQLVLGAAHSGAGRSLEAEEALRAALRTAADDDERARGAGRLSVHLVAHGGRIDEAGALLDQIEPLLVDPAARAFVAADRAKLASIRGDLTAIEVPDASADEPTRLNAAIVAAYAQAMAGDAPACWQTIDAALPLAERHRALLPWSGELVRFSGTFAALGADGPIAAQTWATEHLGRPAPAAEATAGTWRFLVGFAGAVGGAPAAAAAALDRAVHELDGHDLISARPLAIAARGWVAAQCEELDLARSCLDAAVDAAGADGRVRVQVATADAWCDTVEAGVLTSAATAKLVAGAAEAIDGAQVLSGVIVLHELVRLGAPEAAIAPLERVRRSAPDSWLLAFVADRARAELDADIEAIARLARRAEARWPIAAAELHLAPRPRDRPPRRRDRGAGRVRGPSGRDEPGQGAAVDAASDRRSAHGAGAPRRDHRRRRCVEPVGRGGRRRLGPHRGEPAPERLPQARGREPARSRVALRDWRRLDQLTTTVPSSVPAISSDRGYVPGSVMMKPIVAPGTMVWLPAHPIFTASITS
ncbi:MAG: hypothetical protein R2701_09385 [Acidimicrobiales bacterium]